MTGGRSVRRGEFRRGPDLYAERGARDVHGHVSDGHGAGVRPAFRRRRVDAAGGAGGDRRGDAGAGAFAFNIVHSFLNTATQASESAQDRDGDCIIFWRGKDADDDGAGPDGANICLFATYFDTTCGRCAEELRVPGSGHPDQLRGRARRERLHGGAGHGRAEGEARWSRRGHSYEYGDETTSIVVAFIEEDQNGSAGNSIRRCTRSGSIPPRRFRPTCR